jgi:hypothetical protein
MAVSGPTAVFCLLAFLYVATRALLWYITPKPLQGIPHYTPVRPLGDVPRITSYMKNCPKGNPFRFDFFAQVSKDLGPIAQVFVFNQRVVVLSDHQEMEDVLARRTKEFDRASVLTKMWAFRTACETLIWRADFRDVTFRIDVFTSQFLDLDTAWSDSANDRCAFPCL